MQEVGMQPILKIDLSSGQFDRITIPEEWIQKYIGGASLAARILYDYIVQELDPLSPQAPLLFLTGPLTGTSGPAVGRFVICSRSPATGLWAESNCGGFWGPELRKTGIDGLWIQGRADHPVFIRIEDDQVDICDARHLWGLDTYQTQDTILTESGDKSYRVASIGVAGENQIPFSLILCDHGRVAGRTGMGAVMGAKNLKAVAVRGHKKIPVHNPELYNQLRSEANRTMRGFNQTRLLRELGTAGAAEYFDYLEEMPKRYFSRGKLNQELRVSGAGLKDSILTGVSACHACVIACGRVVKLDDGEKRKGPEYETMVGFGPNLCLNDPKISTLLGELCDRYGMDTISMSNTIGLAFRLFEMGKITLLDTEQLSLDWGDDKVIETLIHKTARLEGFGIYLAEGARSLALRFDSVDEAVQVNGLEVPYHDPRGSTGMALVYATSPRGACHNQSDYFIVDLGKTISQIGIEYYSHLAGKEKAANVARHQDWITLFNSLVMCTFANVLPDNVTELLNSAGGYDWETGDMMKAGERGWNLKRVINHRLGLRRTNDRLPTQLLKAYEDSGNDGHTVVPDLESMLKSYYTARGWNPESGFPSRNKLSELELDWVIKDLYQDTLSGEDPQ
jgi:aldehyde:ferredoxin oxidoreductase